MNTFESLFMAHYEKLYTLAFRMTGNKEDAEDVLQEACLNAYRGFNDFKEKSTFYTWIYRIVINEGKKHIKYTEKMPVDLYAEENNMNPEDVYAYINSFGEVEDEVMINTAKETCLQLFMNCMPSKYRVVFTLRSILQFSVQETAEILGTTENSVKVNLHRARSLFKDLMEGKCSLINPKYPCKCSSWVKYARDTKRNILDDDIITIKNEEKAVAQEFKNEVTELIYISELYNTRVVSDSHDRFKKHIKKIINEGQLKLLQNQNKSSS